MNAASTWPSWPVFSVVAGLGFIDADGPAFEQSARIAQRVPHGELHLVHVAPSGAPSRDLINHLRLSVNERADAMKGLHGITIGIHLRWGQVVQGIVYLARDVYADLIVLGSSGGSHLKHWLVGSTADRLVAEAPCPVLVAGSRPKTMEPPCADCARSRAASGGSLWWCELHSQQAEPAHEFSYQRQLPFDPHDSEVIPMGICF